MDEALQRTVPCSEQRDWMRSPGYCVISSYRLVCFLPNLPLPFRDAAFAVSHRALVMEMSQVLHQKINMPREMTWNNHLTLYLALCVFEGALARHDLLHLHENWHWTQQQRSTISILNMPQRNCQRCQSCPRWERNAVQQSSYVDEAESDSENNNYQTSTQDIHILSWNATYPLQT